MSLVDLLIVEGSEANYRSPCASFLGVLKSVNYLTDVIDIFRIKLIIIQSIANKVINQIPLRICKQLTVDGLRKSVGHEVSQEQM